MNLSIFLTWAKWIILIDLLPKHHLQEVVPEYVYVTQTLESTVHVAGVSKVTQTSQSLEAMLIDKTEISILNVDGGEVLAFRSMVGLIISLATDGAVCH